MNLVLIKDIKGALIKDVKGRELIERVALMRSIVRIAKRLRKSLWMHVCPVPWGGT